MSAEKLKNVMNKFKEELERRKEERRNKTLSTWKSLIFRILLLVGVVLIIRYLSSIKANRINDFFNSPDSQKTELTEEPK